MPSASKPKGSGGAAAGAPKAATKASPAVKAEGAAASGSRYSGFAAALREIDATIDVIRANNDRAAKRLG